ncbi:hypothetical protein P879_03683 [Paragonimus westermani]|uniref:Uncharacterized protein n=1 Tax=Paragonimus westermani TaxID=34504 RepID=A0A8T0DY72_9TREM|nr:hypothetical protein P879_03683 [Paragonimus westermani]
METHKVQPLPDHHWMKEMFGLRKVTLLYAVTLCIIGVFGTVQQNETSTEEKIQLEQPQATGVLSKLIEAATLITGVQNNAAGDAILGLSITITTLLSSDQLRNNQSAWWEKISRMMPKQALFFLALLIMQYYWLLIQPTQGMTVEDMNNVSKTWPNNTQTKRAIQNNVAVNADNKLIIGIFVLLVIILLLLLVTLFSQLCNSCKCCRKK